MLSNSKAPCWVECHPFLRANGLRDRAHLVENISSQVPGITYPASAKNGSQRAVPLEPVSLEEESIRVVQEGMAAARVLDAEDDHHPMSGRTPHGLHSLVQEVVDRSWPDQHDPGVVECLDDLLERVATVINAPVRNDKDLAAVLRVQMGKPLKRVPQQERHVHRRGQHDRVTVLERTSAPPAGENDRNGKLFRIDAPDQLFSPIVQGRRFGMRTRAWGRRQVVTVAKGVGDHRSRRQRPGRSLCGIQDRRPS
jgi:hypothetical protein